MLINVKRALGPARAVSFRVVFPSVHGVVVTRLTEVLITAAADEHRDTATVLALVFDVLVSVRLTLVQAEAELLILTPLAFEALFGGVLL